jgi:hypothetical protein
MPSSGEAGSWAACLRAVHHVGDLSLRIAQDEVAVTRGRSLSRGQFAAHNDLPARGIFDRCAAERDGLVITA